MALRDPEVSPGTLSEPHGPYCVDAATATGPGLFVRGGVKAVVWLLGGTHVTSSTPAAAGVAVAAKLVMKAAAVRKRQGAA